ncbi:MAG TPA: DUF6644 family protein [Candidatus Acidoferrales bacterium]|jgi:uncharacterized membrane protein|nr:DUF6644 family protein [Candidatus Acidoferrales bacterium]
MHFFLWLQHTSFITWLSTSVVMATFIEVLHYFSLFLLVGSIVLVDLRVMGLAARKRNATELAQDLFPVMWAGLALNFLSGFILFLGDAAAFYYNWVFHIKLTVILVSVIFGIIVQANVRKWDRPTGIPIGAKVLALISLVLWIGSILASVEVPALTSVG